MRVPSVLLLGSLAACQSDPAMTGGGTSGGEATSADASTTLGSDGTSALTTGGEASSSGEETGATMAEVDWTSCPAGFVDQCAHLRVPLRWDHPDGVGIEIMISKRAASQAPARAALWLLQGGPGYSADYFGAHGIVDSLAAALPDVDIYTYEHRGVGYSSPLSCPQESGGLTKTELGACLDFLLDQVGLEGLAAISTTSAAQDLRYAMAQTNEAAIDTYVYGFSYGTSVALRFLQLFPAELTGVILDGVVAPGHQYFSDWDGQFDPVGMKLAELCAQDVTCSAKLGESPWSTISATIEALEVQSCLQPGGLDYPALFANLLLDSETREAFAPLVYRLGRCSAEDRAAFLNFIDYVNGHYAEQPATKPLATLTWANIMLTELWPEHAVTAAELEQTCEDAVLCPNQWAYNVFWQDAWPRHEDEHAGKWPVIGVPMLAMNGELDAQTTLETAQQIESHLSGSSQTFVAVPYAAHSVLTRSPVLDPEQPTCGLQMLRQFVQDPKAPVDTGCVDTLRPIDFAGTTERASVLFGVPDFWENTAAAAPANERAIRDISAWTADEWDAFLIRWRHGVLRRGG